MTQVLPVPCNYNFFLKGAGWVNYVWYACVNDQSIFIWALSGGAPSICIMEQNSAENKQYTVAPQVPKRSRRQIAQTGVCMHRYIKLRTSPIHVLRQRNLRECRDLMDAKEICAKANLIFSNNLEEKRATWWFRSHFLCRQRNTGLWKMGLCFPRFCQ